MKKILAVFCSLVIIATIFIACSNIQQTSGDNKQESENSSSTTESTTARTTENLSTKFKEAETNKIYPALKKDFDSSFPYEIAATQATTFHLTKQERKTFTKRLTI